MPWRPSRLLIACKVYVIIYLRKEILLKRLHINICASGKRCLTFLLFLNWTRRSYSFIYLFPYAMLKNIWRTGQPQEGRESMDSHENPLVEKVKRRYAKLRLQRHQRFYISVCSTNPVPFFDVRDLSILYVKGSILLMGSWWKHVNLCTRRTSVAKKPLTNDCLFSLD